MSNDKIDHPDSVVAAADAWFPEEYCDEVMPADRSSPTAWVERHGDGWRIAPIEDNDSCDQTGMPITDGEIVSFVSRTDHGDATLTLKADGTWSVDRAMPPGADQVYLPCENIAASVEELVEQMRESSDFQPDDYEISYACWSDGIAFRFDASAGVFERVSDEPAARAH